MYVQTEDKITSTTTGNAFLELSNLTFSIYGGYILRPIFILNFHKIKQRIPISILPRRLVPSQERTSALFTLLVCRNVGLTDISK